MKCDQRSFWAVSLLGDSLKIRITIADLRLLVSIVGLTRMGRQYCAGQPFYNVGSILTQPVKITNQLFV
ncbi:MAG: hypothetical protein ACJA0M_001408 [Chitinophagales bacterium]|jgi:hypothetical protein